MEIRTVGIVGLGALGVMYGNRLTECLGPEQVYFLADEERADRYRREGVFCNGKPCHFSYRTPADAEKLDLIVFAVKATGLSEAIETAAPFVGEKTLLLSVLNGISSERMLKERFGAGNVLYACVQGMDAGKKENQVHYQNMGYISIGHEDGRRDEKLLAVTSLFERTGLEYRVPEDILREQWNKLMLNTGVNQVTAIYGGTYSLVQKDGEARTMMIEAMKEVRKVAESQGISLTDKDIEGWLTLLSGLDPNGRTSMCQDVLAGRKTEVDLFSGTILSLAKEAGIQVPVNEYLYEKIRDLEDGFDRKTTGEGEQTE